MSEQKRRAKPRGQSELFEVATASRPRWADVSQEAQKSVTELFARMLRQRRQAEARSVAPEVDHE